jgi:hypothetical protein
MPRSSRNGSAVLAPPPAAPASSAAAPSPRAIPDNAIHRLGEWQKILELPKCCLKREARLGRLRVSRRGGVLWATGRWIREWVETGEVKRTRPGEETAGPPHPGRP